MRNMNNLFNFCLCNEQRLDKKYQQHCCHMTEFESCQLCEHDQGLLDELVQPAATVLCQSTAVCKMFTFIGIMLVP